MQSSTPALRLGLLRIPSTGRASRRCRFGCQHSERLAVGAAVVDVPSLIASDALKASHPGRIRLKRSCRVTRSRFLHHHVRCRLNHPARTFSFGWWSGSCWGNRPPPARNCSIFSRCCAHNPEPLIMIQREGWVWLSAVTPHPLRRCPSEHMHCYWFAGSTSCQKQRQPWWVAIDAISSHSGQTHNGHLRLRYRGWLHE